MEDRTQNNLARGNMSPNLVDYATARADFSWVDVRRALDGLLNGGLNIPHEAVDRHAMGPCELSW
jgi:acetyl-CoA synthetase